MKKLLFVVTAVLCGFFAHGQTASVSSAFPDLEPLFTVPASSSSDIHSEELICAALLFSSCEENSRPFLDSLSVYKSLEAEVSSEAFLSQEEKVRAESVLFLMYDKVLLRYRETASRADEMLLTGIYNCVSSSVLYYALASAARLRVSAQRTPEHSFCTVTFSDGTRVDVETTNPMGFNPGKKKPAGGNSYYVVPAKKYNGRHEISARQLAGLVARNLCSVSMNKNDYNTAVPLAAARMCFTESSQEEIPDDSRSDFFLVCSNYSVWLQRRREYENAVFWLERVFARWNGRAELRAQYDSAVFNSVAALCNSGKYSEADAFFALRAEHVSPEIKQNAVTAIFLATVKGESDAMDDERAIQYLSETLSAMQAKNGANTKEYRQVQSLLESHWHSKITAVSKESGWLEATRVCAQAVNSLPSSAHLKTLHTQCLGNYDAQIHNEFARLANSGKTEEARAVLEKGLSEHPESKILSRDLKLLSR